MIEEGAGALGDAISKTGSAGKVIGSTVGGALTGLAVAEGLAVGVPVAAAGLSTLGGTAAALGVLGASIAAGSTVPVVGTIVGAVVGAVAAIVTFFNNEPSPEFARELLAVFRTWPNVLREWIDERETFGVPHDHSALRSRWGYVEMLRRVAGEVGPDPFEDPVWRKDFAAGRVDPVAPAKLPDLKVLGLHATDAEAKAAAAAIKSAMLPHTTVKSVSTPRGSFVRIAFKPHVYVPEGFDAPPQVIARPRFFTYKSRVPMIQTTDTQSTSSFPPSAQVQERAQKLREALAGYAFVKEVRIVPLRTATVPDDAVYGFEVVVEPTTTLTQRNEVRSLLAVLASTWAAGARNTVVTDDGGLLSQAPTPVAMKFPPSAQVQERAQKLREALASLPWVRGVDVVGTKASPVPDDKAYALQVVVAPDATAAQRHEVEVLSTIALNAMPGAVGVHRVYVVNDQALGDTATTVAWVAGGAVVAGLLGLVAWRASKAPAGRLLGAVREILYDEDYTGPRWTYGLSYRPAAYATVPDGRIVLADRRDPRFTHGTIQYPRQLSDAEVENFDLTFVSSTEGRREEQVQPVIARSYAAVPAPVAVRAPAIRAARAPRKTREWVQVEGRKQEKGNPWHVRYDGTNEHARIWTDGWDAVDWTARKGGENTESEEFAEGRVPFEYGSETLKAAIREARSQVLAWLDSGSSSGLLGAVQENGRTYLSPHIASALDEELRRV